ncbi:ARPP-1 family domain-containing protein [Salana multivorans]
MFRWAGRGAPSEGSASEQLVARVSARPPGRRAVGRGATTGALTIFPIWGERTFPVSYTMEQSAIHVSESVDGQSVPRLDAVNSGDLPTLLLEGQLLEGGLQHRMLVRSTLLAPRSRSRLEVVCVEQGRWGRTSASGAHSSRGRRAATRVRAGLRSPDRQHEVWRRVSGYDARLGTSATSSYVEHADRAASHAALIADSFRAFPGQIGVVVGIAGQPLSAEVFDSPRILAAQFRPIVEAAAMDALGQPALPTPARRAIRFIERAGLVVRRPEAEAGIAVTLAGRTQYADLRAVHWQGRALHTLLTNPRHDLVLAA